MIDSADEESEAESPDAQEVESADAKAGECDVKQAPDRKVRNSVISRDPDALRRVQKEDPRVAEAVQIFEGTVVDMHVM